MRENRQHFAGCGSLQQEPEHNGLMSKFEKNLICRESDEEGCPSYEGDSSSPGGGDGSTGEGV
jgi:hypothetical protein